jgi:hypothetical protein
MKKTQYSVHDLLGIRNKMMEKAEVPDCDFLSFGNKPDGSACRWAKTKTSDLRDPTSRKPNNKKVILESTKLG